VKSVVFFAADSTNKQTIFIQRMKNLMFRPIHTDVIQGGTGSSESPLLTSFSKEYRP